MYVSAIALGDRATHGETVGQDVATSCGRKATDLFVLHRTCGRTRS
jgi:hypothetical protein